MYRTQKLIIIAACLFSVHNLEEWVSMDWWLRHYPHINPGQLTAGQFGIAVMLVTLLGWLVLVKAYRDERYRRSVLVAFTSLIFLNAFFPHIILAAIMYTYTPGLVTALTLYLPFTCVVGKYLPVLGLPGKRIVEAAVLGPLVGVLATVVAVQMARFFHF